MRLMRDFFVFCLVFVVCATWIFSGWPRVWRNPSIPPVVQKVWADTNKTFSLTSDAESWTATPSGGSSLTMAWSSASSCPVDGGALRTHDTKGGGGGTSSNNYWEWTGTWEDLGVPAGNTVTQVRGGYQYEVAQYGNAESQTGPLEFRTGGSCALEAELLAAATISSTVSCTDRGQGSDVSVPAGSQASDSTICFRLNNTANMAGGGRTIEIFEDTIFLTTTDSAGGTVSITVDDGTVAYGSLAEGATQDTFTLGAADRQIVTNTGDVTIFINIQGAATSDPDLWALVATAGTDEFRHRYASDDVGTTWVALTDSYQLLTESIAAGATAPLDLEIQVPTSTSATSTQTHTITVQAVQQ